jgi:MHS family citrate/tricarballylate:H+ symporter-like MFS transporter
MTAGALDQIRPDEGSAQPLPLGRLGAVVIGNALEFYDFLTFAYFAIQIGQTFFPSTSASASLLSALATFGAGFLTRPLGGVVIGMLGDRVGRKPAMLLSFGLMGLSMVGLALTPSYAAIGVAAPVLVLAFRLVQGFALGGEVGPSTAYLIEAAPPGQRGLYCSLQFASQRLAVLVAGLVGVSLAAFLDDAALTAWGWRIALLLGAAVIPFGLIIRSRLPETLPDAERPRAVTALRPSFRPILLGLLMMSGLTIGSYVIDYMATFARTTLSMPAKVAFGALVTSGIVGIASMTAAGWLTDRLGRRPVMIGASLLLLAALFPAYGLLTHLRTPWALYGVTALLTALHSFCATPALVGLTESLPRESRSGALGMTYAVAIALFGGSAQFVVTWLIINTGNPLAPAGYMAAALSAGLVGMWLMAETAPVRVSARPPSSPPHAPSAPRTP